MNTSYEVYCTHLDIPLLIIPVEDTSKYTTKPLKWIRYATAAVLGSEGDLMKYIEDDIDVETCEEDDLTLDMEDESPSERKLTFHSTSPIRFIDKDVSYTCDSDITQDADESQASFKNKTGKRDGSATLVTSLKGLFADPCHIIPFSKGSEYIQAVSRWRNRMDEPVIEDIDDIRNGIFLDCTPHKYLATGKMGVLHTPNFALSTNEVLPRRLAYSLTTGKKLKTKFRFTPHYLSLDESRCTRRTKKANKALLQRDFRYPPEIKDGWPVDWPPAFLWDFNYGVAVAKRYGNAEATNILNDTARSHYYPEDSKNTGVHARSEIQNHRYNTRAKTGREACHKEEQKLSDASDNVSAPSVLFGPRVSETVKDEGGEQERYHQ